MKKGLVLLFLVTVFLLSASSVMAQCAPCGDAVSACPQVPSEPFCVTYHENNCLLAAPIDGNAYYYGDTVKVLFEPVLYRDGVWFYGWSHNPKGYANYGYNYDTFKMPGKNVDLYAICIPIYWPEPETPVTDPPAVVTPQPIQ